VTEKILPNLKGKKTCLFVSLPVGAFLGSPQQKEEGF
jgi:hypothetical protein